MPFGSRAKRPCREQGDAGLVPGGTARLHRRADRALDNATGISVDRATGEKLDYKALKTSVPAQPRSFFCAADAYAFQAVVYNSITDKGCLTGVAEGRIP